MPLVRANPLTQAAEAYDSHHTNKVDVYSFAVFLLSHFPRMKPSSSGGHSPRGFSRTARRAFSPTQHPLAVCAHAVFRKCEYPDGRSLCLKYVFLDAKGKLFDPATRPMIGVERDDGNLGLIVMRCMAGPVGSVGFDGDVEDGIG
jgi:hypothetical protein